MTTALIQAVVNGGSPTRGGVTVAANETVALSGVNTSGWNSQIWEIYSYPTGFNPGGTWSLGADGATWQNTKVTPDVWNTGATPGKFMVRVRVNANPFARNSDGSPNSFYVAALTDESTAFDFPYPNGVHDLGYLETTQFSAQGWVGPQRQNLAILGAMTGGIGSGPLNAVSVPSAASYTISGTIGIAASGSGPLLAAKGDIVTGETDTALIAGSLPQGTPWIVDFATLQSTMNWASASFGEIGVVVATGTTMSDTAYAINAFWDGPTEVGVYVEHFHPGAGRLTTSNQVNPVPTVSGSYVRFRLLNDGTILHYQIGGNGLLWTDWFSETTPSSLAYWGFCIGNQGGGGTTSQLQAAIFRNNLLGLTVPQVAVTGTTGNGVSPIVVTTGTAHGLMTGDLVATHGIGGNTAANTGAGADLSGAAPIIVLSPTTFSMPGTTGNGAYTSGGTVTCVSR